MMFKPRLSGFFRFLGQYILVVYCLKLSSKIPMIGFLLLISGCFGMVFILLWRFPFLGRLAQVVRAHA